MNNKPHSKETKLKMSISHLGKKKYNLPEQDIVNRLLNTSATTRSIAKEIGCDSSTIKVLFRKHTTIEQRLECKYNKQRVSLKENGNASKHIGKIAIKLKVWEGKKHTKEAKEKQSKWHTGKDVKIETRKKISAYNQNIKLEDWTGFEITEKARQRHSKELKEWRKRVFERDNFTCQMCGKIGERLHAHHIKPFSKFPELRFELSNGVTLCANPCHKKTISKEKEYEYLFSK